MDSRSAGEDKQHARGNIAEWAITITLFLFATTTLAQAFVIPTGSMEDTLLIGDHLLVDKLAYSPADRAANLFLPYEQPKHGDIIVFRYPGDISQTYVKRLIGVPGDRLKMVGRVLYRNGVPLREPYVVHKFPYDPARDNFPGNGLLPVREPLARELQMDMIEHHVVNGEVVVPPHSYFTMGDNRDDSSDSRYWGFVPQANVIGKPLLIYWSYRATTDQIEGSSPVSLLRLFTDIGEHFFTRTRWNRTFRLIRGFPDSQLESATNPS
jgi:signal peptidase I